MAPLVWVSYYISLRASSPGRSAGGAGKRLWNFNICIAKFDAKMLIGGDDISNDVITLGTCFSMFVYIRARFRFVLIGGNLTAYSARSHRGIGGGMGHLHDDIIYYYDQNPSGFSFLVQITAFVI